MGIPWNLLGIHDMSHKTLCIPKGYLSRVSKLMKPCAFPKVSLSRVSKTYELVAPITNLDQIIMYPILSILILMII